MESAQSDLALPPPEASEVVAVFERAWSAIRQRWPETPEVVMLLGSGVVNGQLRKNGHFSADRWNHVQGKRSECLIAGESLIRTAREIFGTLIHEAAHGINATRGIEDTSRQGRYHNKNYRDTAEEIGLEVEKMAPFGYCKTTVNDGLAAEFLGEIEEIDRVAKQYVRLLTFDTKKKRNGKPFAVCACPEPRKIEGSKKMFEFGPIVCGCCNTNFQVQEPEVEEGEDGEGEED